MVNYTAKYYIEQVAQAADQYREAKIGQPELQLDGWLADWMNRNRIVDAERDLFSAEVEAIVETDSELWRLVASMEPQQVKKLFESVESDLRASLSLTSSLIFAGDTRVAACYSRYVTGKLRRPRRQRTKKNRSPRDPNAKTDTNN